MTTMQWPFPDWNPEYWPATLCVFLGTSFALLAWKLLARPPFPPEAPKAFDALPVIGSLQWFTRRDVFMAEGARASPSGHFSFYVGKNMVVGLTGEAGRRMFFENKGLELGKGYSVLFNATPEINDKNSAESFDSKIIRFFGRTARKEWLNNVVPTLLSDVRAAIEDLGSRPVHVLNPFEDFYRLVYQLTMRTVGCSDIAEDPAALRRTLGIFEMIEGSTAPVSMAAAVVFPWLPTKRYLHMLWGGTRFYMILAKILENRRKTGERKNDAMQLLIDQGEDTGSIVKFILASLFAGLINSGINAAWLVAFLASDRHWYAEIQKEVDQAVARHRRSPEQTPVEVLGTLTMEDFEVEFPLLDLCLRETIRRTMPGTAFRYNDSGRDLPIGGSAEVVPRNAFAVYPLDDIHHNPEVYPDPERWDPGRYLPDRTEDKRAGPHGYVGWGSGRHPCLGIKFAKLEITSMTTFFMASFEFELCDKDGTPTQNVPPIDRRRYAAHKPRDPPHVKYWARA